jgi:hypothetical protein
LREIFNSHRRGEGEPYRSWKVVVEEQMGIIFQSPACGALLIDVARFAVARARQISLKVKALIMGGRFLLFHAHRRI